MQPNNIINGAQGAKLGNGTQAHNGANIEHGRLIAAHLLEGSDRKRRDEIADTPIERSNQQYVLENRPPGFAGVL
ncbi:MAG: hypothetical protein DRQ64_00975, partial [Gammaproteobacteria bacterium]